MLVAFLGQSGRFKINTGFLLLPKGPFGAVFDVHRVLVNISKTTNLERLDFARLN